MIPGIDVNRAHLWLALTHPYFGAMNLAAYTTCMSAAVAQTWYIAWAQMLLDCSYPVSKPSADK